MSTLVTYFSAEGTTARVAKEFAEKTGAASVDAKLVYSASDI